MEREGKKRTGLLILARTGVELVRRGGGESKKSAGEKKEGTNKKRAAIGAARPGSYTTPQLAPKLFVSRLERPS